MAPKGRRARRSRRGRIDSVVFPVLFTAKEGEDRVTSVRTLYETFDRTRPFRIHSIWGKVAAYGSTNAFYQFEAYGPQSSADNTWVSPVSMVSEVGSRFRYLIPATQVGWYPSDTAIDTILFKLKNVCIDKTKDTGLTGIVNFRIEMQPREIDETCPKVMVPPPALVAYSSGSSSICVLPDESSSDEYFST